MRQEQCRGGAEGAGVSQGVAKCLGGFGAVDLCNTHLPLGTTHGGGWGTHVVGMRGPIRLVAGESRVAALVALGLD